MLVFDHFGKKYIICWNILYVVKYLSLSSRLIMNTPKFIDSLLFEKNKIVIFLYLNLQSNS